VGIACAVGVSKQVAADIFESSEYISQLILLIDMRIIGCLSEKEDGKFEEPLRQWGTTKLGDGR
jgi:hypothetical protein